jgi:hypothetical protein
MYGDDGAAVVVFARKQHAVFELADRFSEAFQLALNFAIDVFAFAGQIEERVDVADRGRDLAVLADGGLEALPFLEDLLAGGLVVPEVRVGDLFFDSG